jgi:hypothetical protein
MSVPSGTRAVFRRLRDHAWLAAACIPIPVIALVLVITGVAPVGFLALAAACAFLMAVLMSGMDDRATAAPRRSPH